MNQLETLKGRRVIAVTTHDGEPISVTVFALPVSKMDELLDVLSDSIANMVSNPNTWILVRKAAPERAAFLLWILY